MARCPARSSARPPPGPRSGSPAAARIPYGFGWELTAQRGHPRIGHGGSWQGFRTTIQRYPEYGLTVIVLANLAEAEPEAIALGIAGLLEPALAAPHLRRSRRARKHERVRRGRFPSCSGPSPTAGPCRDDPALEAFLLPARRRRSASCSSPASTWTFAGCDDVPGKNIERLGARIAQVCYARAVGGDAGHLVDVAYTAEGAAAFIDWYDF